MCVDGGGLYIDKDEQTEIKNLRGMNRQRSSEQSRITTIAHFRNSYREGSRTHWPKCSDKNNKDKDTSLNNI